MKHKSQAGFSIAVVSATVVVVIALLVGSGYMKRDVNAANKEPDEFTPTQQREKQDRLETELITLEHTGFEPNEISRPQGAFVLGVDNRSGVEPIELQFMRADGQRLKALQTPKRKVSWREVVDLPPGQYLLSVADHPDWTCNVTILPR